MSTSIPSSNPIFLSDNKDIIWDKIFSIKKVGAGTLNELFEKGANLESDTLIQIAKLFESDKSILNLIEQGYSSGFNDLEHLEQIELIKLLVPFKGIVTKNNKTMITTFGVRCYLTNLIVKICSKYNDLI